MPQMSYVRGLDGSRRTFIATPTTDGKFGVAYTTSLMQSLAILQASGIGYDYCVEAGNCHVDDARNALVRQFRVSGCEQMVFLDADIGWEPEALLRLIRHERDLVAGIYPLKNHDMTEDYPIRMPPGKDIVADTDGLVEAEGLPTGFMKISRDCIERMAEAHGGRKYWGRGQGRDELPHVILFERTFEGGARHSGDYAFCNKWRRLGGRMYADPEIRFTHEGNHQWHGHLGEHWRRSNGIYRDRYRAAAGRLRKGTPVEGDFEALLEYYNNPYAPDAGMLQACYEMAGRCDRPVLECGSGLTTLVMALAGADIDALEHSREHALRTQMMLDEWGLENATIYLTAIEGGWYATGGMPERKYGLVVSDGPPRHLSDRGLLFERMAGRIERAAVIIDDAHDPACMEAFRAWAGDEIINRGSYAVAAPKEG